MKTAGLNQSFGALTVEHPEDKPFLRDLLSANFTDIMGSKQIYRNTITLPDTPKVQGYDFNQGVDHRALLQSFLSTGFQATNVGLAILQINSMIKRRQQPVEAANATADKDPSTSLSCTIFLSYTSNLISSGVRESICYLAEHRMVDVLVTTAGGIEEDLIKCLGQIYMGDFTLSGKDLFKKGLDRIGNLLMPDENYTLFQKWLTSILTQMLLEQNTQGVRWTPSKMIHRLGKEINHPESVCYWAYKNSIPVFSPALTDGAIGDVLYIFSAENPGLILDIVEDISGINRIAVNARSTGMIILGGGLAKHHTCNANVWREGADYAVYVNTAQEFDGCDSGARPDEAVSWGKIKLEAQPVKVFADATIIFPLLVAETFAVNADKKTTAKEN
ncbi:putative deoxyhypusine synthase [Scophthalmus maximus]|uniref:deoxyhypusine synthase n=1 Tax=Scophthalmus maximus TaxID=52904 RepID=A0A2U9CWC9_SCOMX|nr:deoxyhypusine synthase [Scophthalmus maximus]XP_035471471.1 deoxyhypusine synthase [Scophthalmus maximus]AWP18802.1 putative deoxyhypusine synthase [Scophthalmus maximus]